LTTPSNPLASKKSADAWVRRANRFGKLKRYDDALATYSKALGLNPELAEAWLGRGNVYAALGSFSQAILAFEKALTLRPDLPEAWLGCGNALHKLKAHDGALVAYECALKLKPDLAEAWLGRANVYYSLGRYKEAAPAYADALAHTNIPKYAQGALFDSKMCICDWDDFSVAHDRIFRDVTDGKHSVDPFVFINVSSASVDQLECAKLYSRDKFPPAPNLWQGERYSHERIRVAYISADLRDHATSYLLAGVFEQHDKKLFETIAISLGNDSQSEMRARLECSFERFIEVGSKSDSEVANLLRDLEVDIAVDLMGHTADSRFGIFALRPAPVQVNYLGYPGTTGADFMDYIIADRYVIPENQQKYYSEKIVYLPESFQANDSRRPIAGGALCRADAGLPESGFVFSSLNSNRKFTPGVFDIWMRILREVEGTVLWLFAGDAAAEHNLRREAIARDVEPTRLVFASSLPYRDHLARYRLAGLFLDTFPFNAGATASDALWAGLPLITCSGEAFASRMAGSLLNAVGLPELVVRSLEEYETLALKLARNPFILASIKEKLARNRDTCALFNTERFTRHIEAAYSLMCERSRLGKVAASFAVKQIS
jgi:protein O-GlcNAc transferase